MHCSDSPLFKEARGGVNFNTSEVRKSKKLKKWGGGEGVATFAMSFLQGLSFLHSKITLVFAKLCSTFEEKLFFLPT